MNANQMLKKLEYAEVDSRLARHPDYRRLLLDERLALKAAAENGKGLDSAMRETQRVIAMWSPVVGFDVLAD